MWNEQTALARDSEVETFLYVVKWFSEGAVKSDVLYFHILLLAQNWRKERTVLGILSEKDIWVKFGKTSLKFNGKSWIIAHIESEQVCGKPTAFLGRHSEQKSFYV